jgi:outer membrane lipoprotein SlyB
VTTLPSSRRLYLGAAVVGALVGAAVGAVGAFVGVAVGNKVGALEGAAVGEVGATDGVLVGLLVGASVVMWSPLTLVIKTASTSTLVAVATELVNFASDAEFVDIQSVRGIKMIAFTRTILSANTALEGYEVGILVGKLLLPLLPLQLDPTSHEREASAQEISSVGIYIFIIAQVSALTH